MYQKTALVVDDSPTSQAVLKRMLRDFDYHVDTQKSGNDALAYLQTHSPHVIFLDHIMPGIDGFGVLRQLKANPRLRGIPVVMYTSQNAPRYASEAKALGAIGVLPKQVSGKDLAYVLERAEQMGTSAASTIDDEIVIDVDNSEVDAADTATVLEQTEQLTEFELLKQTLHTELEQQRRELMAQQRALAEQLERQLLTQSLQLSHWQQRSHWRSIAAGVLILLPLFAAMHFSAQVSDQQKLLTQLQQHMQTRQIASAPVATPPSTANMDRDQNKADVEDVKFMLETLIATVEAQARAGNPVQARQVMHDLEQNSEMSLANAASKAAREQSGPGENSEEESDKQ